MTDRQTIYTALRDAIDWQMSFAESNHDGSPEREKALAKAEQYRNLIRKRYPGMPVDDSHHFAGARLVGIGELSAKGMLSIASDVK